MNYVFSYIADFVALLFPDLCQACGKNLYHQEEVFCTKCLYHLPYTNFHVRPDNQAARQFWGRVPLEQVAAFLYFSKGGKVQELMHQFKYKNRPDIGEYIGKMMGEQLISNPVWASVDMVVPVPLHHLKQNRRGYNQSACFASGLGKSMQKPLVENNLIRQLFTGSQTKHSRFSRYENMKDIFKINKPEEFSGKHVLLVDDIITTGATLEACSQALLNVPDVKVSIAAMAFTQ